MKLIHTGDWHLGKLLENESRLDEQALFLQDFIDLCEGHEADVVLISGDIYDNGNPPAKAESLFYNTLKTLANGGERLVVVISGNHDSPHRLGAVTPLAKELGILMVTQIQATDFENQYGQFKVLATCPGGLKISVGQEELALALLPYPSEQRLNKILSEELTDDALQKSYSEQVKSLLSEASQVFSETSLNVVLSHLFVGGSETSESERPIQVGGGYTVFREAFPPQADYVALGHLHRPQETRIGQTLVRYAGAPLQYSRSEIGYAKSVTLIETQPLPALTQVEGQLNLFESEPAPKESAFKVSELWLHNHKPIVVWRVQGVEAALEKLEAEKTTSCWAYLEIQMDRPLRQDELKAIKQLKPDLLAVMPILPNAAGVAWEAAAEEETVDLETLFKAFHMQELGCEADTALLDLFLKLATEEADDETHSTDISGY